MANEGATLHEADTEETRMIVASPSSRMAAMRRNVRMSGVGARARPIKGPGQEWHLLVTLDLITVHAVQLS